MTVMENELNEGEIISFLLAQFRNSKSMAPTNSEFYSVQKEFKSYTLCVDGRHLVFLFASETPIFVLQELANQTAESLSSVCL